MSIPVFYAVFEFKLSPMVTKIDFTANVFSVVLGGMGLNGTMNGTMGL